MEAFIAENSPRLLLFVLLSVLWVLPWKAVALWRAARSAHTVWFVVLLLVQTLAVLEIIYIFIVHPRLEKKKAIAEQTLGV